MIHMAQAASFSKHGLLKPESEVPVHWGNSPVGPLPSLVLRQGQMSPVPWLGREGMLEGVPAACVPGLHAHINLLSGSLLVLKFCLPPWVSSLIYPGARPSLLVGQDLDTPSTQTFLLQLDPSPPAHESHIYLDRPLGLIPSEQNPCFTGTPTAAKMQLLNPCQTFSEQA